MNKNTVVIAEDHEIVRHSFKLMVNKFKKFEVIDEAPNGKILIDIIEQTTIKPDIVLTDISMPVMDGYKAVKHLTISYPQIKCIALTVFGDTQSVSKMIDCGAKGFVLKSSSPKFLEDTMLEVMKTGAFYNSFIVDKIKNKITYDDTENDNIIQSKLLTEREMVFLKYCYSELEYKEIAVLMNISPKTVDGYRESVFAKLHINSREGLMMYVVKKGWHEN